jgi:MFS transporter, ACS family, tartrate transporter
MLMNPEARGDILASCLVSCTESGGSSLRTVSSSQRDILRHAALSKIARRLIPFLFILHLIAFLDRSNIPFAQLQMGVSLSFTYAVYGMGAGIFFIGYLLFGVPSTMALEKVGPRRWISFIMIIWGIITISMAAINSPFSFYSLRFLLGVAEAGFFPGVIFYLMNWLPAAERARYFSYFLVAIPLAGIAGSLTAGLILKLDIFAGIAGWQWLFLAEGLPAVLFGIMVFFYLTDCPEKASWLSPEEKMWIQDELRLEEGKVHLSTTVKEGLFGRKVITLGLIYSTFIFAGTGLILWSPLMIQGFFNLNASTASFAATLTSIASALAMVITGAHSDRTGERLWHVALPAFIGAMGIVMVIFLPRTIFTFVALIVASAGMSGLYGPFWAIPTRFLKGDAAATGLALINALGNIAAFLGPFAIGFARDRTGDFSSSLAMMAVALCLGGGLMVLTPWLHETELGRNSIEDRR